MPRISASLPQSAYGTLGLVTNPFSPHEPDGAVPLGLALESHGSAARLLGALARAVCEERPGVIWVEKSPGDDYPAVLALAEVLDVLSHGEEVSVLPVYIQLQAMRGGRIRGALSMTAEKVTGSRCDVTLAAWTLAVLREPDTSLSEWAPLEGADLCELLGILESDPIAGAETLFGPLKAEREGVRQDMELVMRISAARQERQPTDPEEGDDSEEDDLTDPGRDAFVEPLAARDEQAPRGEEPRIAPGGPLVSEVVDYVVAHTGTHLSPVVARGIQAYVAQGTSSMAQEMKVTKAPRKTLRALTRFVGTRFAKTALIWDRFDPWSFMDAEMRLRVATSLTEVRWAIADTGVVVVLAAPGQVPELEEQFAAATRVSWETPFLERIERGGVPFDEEAGRSWIVSAALNGDGEAPAWADDVIALAIEVGGTLEDGAAAAAAAVESAASRGDGQVTADDLAVGRVATG